MSNKVYDLVTEQILEQLKAGVIPWRRPWQTEGPAINYITRKEYKGINRLLLAGGEYITYKQCKAKGGSIKKGEKSSIAVFYKSYDTEDADGNRITIPVLRYYRVFSIHQCEGIASKLEPLQSSNVEPIETAEKIYNNYVTAEGIRSSNNNPNRAYYDPSIDIINLPPIERYEQAEEYYSTAFHEAAHSTGHSSRLNRLTETAAFGSESYSREELTAEISAAYLCEFAGLDNEKTLPNSAAYIDGWSKALKKDSKAIVTAAAKAEKASAYILDATLEVIETEPEETPDEAGQTNNDPIVPISGGLDEHPDARPVIITGRNDYAEEKKPEAATSGPADEKVSNAVLTKALAMLKDGNIDELEKALKEQLYLQQSDNKTSKNQKLAVLKRIIKEAHKCPNKALHGMFKVPDEGMYLGYYGYCDGYRAIRTLEEYPLPKVDERAEALTIHKIIPNVEDCKIYDPHKVDIKALKAAKASKEKLVNIGKYCFNTVYLLDMLTYFDTNSIYLNKEYTTSPAYLKNDAGEDGCLMPVKAKEAAKDIELNSNQPHCTPEGNCTGKDCSTFESCQG